MDIVGLSLALGGSATFLLGYNARQHRGEPKGWIAEALGVIVGISGIGILGLSALQHVLAR